MGLSSKNREVLNTPENMICSHLVDVQYSSSDQLDSSRSLSSGCRRLIQPPLCYCSLLQTNESIVTTIHVAAEVFQTCVWLSLFQLLLSFFRKISFFMVGFPFFLFADKLSDFEALYPHYQVSLSSVHVDLNPKCGELLSICECN
jgi:hypothetical protein